MTPNIVTHLDRSLKQSTYKDVAPCAFPEIGSGFANKMSYSCHSLFLSNMYLEENNFLLTKDYH